LTLPRRRPDRPIESVELRISFRADRETSRKIKEAIPSVLVKGGVCEVRIEAEQPAEMAEKARTLLEKIRTIV
jgi:hypothetical protein